MCQRLKFIKCCITDSYRLLFMLDLTLFLW
nr:MAG TPA: hypothetical protein [Caudoviricetes sp.]